MDDSPPSEYITCLGDLYTIAWMEDSESHNLKKETIKQQCEKVKERTSNLKNYEAGSHVMEYESKEIKPERSRFVHSVSRVLSFEGSLRRKSQASKSHKMRFCFGGEIPLLAH